MHARFLSLTLALLHMSRHTPANDAPKDPPCLVDRDHDEGVVVLEPRVQELHLHRE